MSQGVLRRGSATTARDFSKRAGGAAQAICYDRIEKLQRTREDTRGAATLLRSSGPGVVQGPGHHGRASGYVPRRSPDTLCPHREPLPSRRRSPLLRPRVRMTSPPEPAADADCRRLLDHWLATGTMPGSAEVTPLASAPPAQLEQTLWAFAREHGAAALPLLSSFADH